MTTITINDDLPLKKHAFNSIAELFDALEEQNLFVVLHELSAEDVSGDTKKKAESTAEQWEHNPSDFSDV